MKKIKFLIFSLMFAIFTTAFGLFGGGGKGSSTAVLLKILAVETASKSEHIKNTLEAIQQTKHLASQLEYDVKNAIQMGKDIANGNEYAIKDLIHKVLNYQETSQSIMYEQDKILGKMKEIFKISDNLKGMDINQLDTELKKVKEQSQYAVYDAMTNAGFSATLQQDQQNISRLVNSANTAQGQLQALQAISNLLGEQNAILLKMGTLMETQTKAVAMAQGAENTTESIEENQLKEIRRTDDDNNKDNLEKIKQAGKKKVKIGG